MLAPQVYVVVLCCPEWEGIHLHVCMWHVFRSQRHWVLRSWNSWLFWDTWHGCWEPNLGPLVEPSLQPQQWKVVLKQFSNSDKSEASVKPKMLHLHVCLCILYVPRAPWGQKRTYQKETLEVSSRSGTDGSADHFKELNVPGPCVSMRHSNPLYSDLSCGFTEQSYGRRKGSTKGHALSSLWICVTTFGVI